MLVIVLNEEGASMKKGKKKQGRELSHDRQRIFDQRLSLNYK